MVSNINQVMYPVYDSYYHDQIKGNVTSIYTTSTSGTTSTANTTSAQEATTETTDSASATALTAFEEIFIDNCGPVVHNSDLESIIDIEALNLLPQNIAMPCGLLPRFYPSDRFTSLESISDGTVYRILRTGVWDFNQRYNFTNIDARSNWWINITDFRYPVWMKYRSTMKPQKQWGIIYNDLEAGSYYLHINITYDATLFNGEKWVVVSGNTNSYSTRNYGIIVLLAILAGAIVIMYILLIKTWLGYHATRPK